VYFEIIVLLQGCALGNYLVYKSFNQACSVLGKANTQEKSHFRMPNFVLSKCATPMNSPLERIIYTTNSYADFVMKKTGTHNQIRSGANLLNIFL